MRTVPGRMGIHLLLHASLLISQAALYYIRYMITQISEVTNAIAERVPEPSWTELDLLMPAQLMNQK